MSAREFNDAATPIGQAWFRRQFHLAVPAPAVESYVIPGARRTAVRGRQIIEFYPPSYATDDTIIAHFRFAFAMSRSIWECWSQHSRRSIRP